MIRFSRLGFLFGFILLLTGCVYKDIPQPQPPEPEPVDCSQTTLAISLAEKTDPSNCFSIDGSFSINVTGGNPPYLFSYNGGDYQSASFLQGLGSGVYLITVQDSTHCKKSMSVEITTDESTLVADAVIEDDTDCLSDNGSVTVTATGGTAPYTFQFGTEDPGTQNSWTGLKVGYYAITVRDADNCLWLVNAWVHHADTGTSFATDIEPILNTYCSISGCHNGDNGANRDWTVFSNVKAKALQIKQRTQNRSMPVGSSMTQDEIDLIACWVDDGAKQN